jgi:hypothetical protein
MYYLSSGSIGKNHNNSKNKTNFMALVRERTTPTERTPLVGEVSANFLQIKVLRVQRDGSMCAKS